MAYQNHQESCIICLDPSPSLVSNVRCRCVYWYHTACLNATPNKTHCPMCRSEVGPIYIDTDPITISTPLVSTNVVVQQHVAPPIQLQTKIISFLCVISLIIIVIFIILTFMFVL